MAKCTLSLILGFLTLLSVCFNIINATPWSNVWAVRIEGGEDIAKAVALKNNHEYLGKVNILKFQPILLYFTLLFSSTGRRS